MTTITTPQQPRKRQGSTAASSSLNEITLNVIIHGGRNLVAKDKNLFGKKGTSDVFVKLSLLNKVWGQTKVQMKTLTPVWNESFPIKIVGEQPTKQCLASSVQFTIWDYDKLSSADPMGSVTVPVYDVIASADGTISRQWYTVQNGKRGTTEYCKNATGELEITISMVASRAVELIPGNVHPIRGHSNLMVALSWDVEYGQNIDLDASCVAISRTDGNVLMNETVYYGNLSNTNRSVYHSGDEVTGIAVGDDEVIVCNLHHIPYDVIAMYFVLSIVTPNRTFNDVKSARVKIIDKDTGNTVCQMNPSERLGKFTSLFLCRLHRNSNNGEWTVSPIEEGHETARDFGTLIPHIKSYSRDIVPNIIIDPDEKVAIMRKNGVIRISDYYRPTSSDSSGNSKLPEWLTFGLAWDITDGKNIDLDASVICLDSDLTKRDLVYFRHLTSNDGAIIHGGDEREGDVVGDDEKIKFSLNSIDPDIKYLGIVVNSYSGQELDDIAAASCHLFDTSNPSKDIAVYKLTNASVLDKHTAIVMACLYRGNDGDWFLQILSYPAMGKTVHDNIDELQLCLRQNPPQAAVEPTIIVENEDEEAEIDLSMPSFVPHNEDTDIVVVPIEQIQQYAKEQEISIPPTK